MTDSGRTRRLAGEPRDAVVSIVMAAYNVDQYLEAAARSVLEQSYDELELIIVDDGSSDRTSYICETLRGADSRVRVVHQPNGGVAKARNAGMAIASGRWLTFVDADDLLPTDALERLVAAVTEHSASCVIAAIVGFTDGSEPVDVLRSTGAVVMTDGRSAQARLLYQRLVNGPYAKLFDMRALGDQRFGEGIRVAEDLLFNVQAMARMEKVALMPGATYLYRQRPDGAMMSSMTAPRMDSLTVVSELVRAFQRTGDVDLIKASKNRAFMEGVFVGSRAREIETDGELLNKSISLVKEHRWTVVRDRRSRGAYRILAALSIANTGLVLRSFGAFSRRRMVAS